MCPLPAVAPVSGQVFGRPLSWGLEEPSQSAMTTGRARDPFSAASRPEAWSRALSQLGLGTRLCSASYQLHHVAPPLVCNQGSLYLDCGMWEGFDEEKDVGGV